MNNLFYIVGVVVAVLAVLAFFDLRWEIAAMARKRELIGTGKR